MSFSWWLKNVKSRSKIALFSNKHHLKFDFQKRNKLYFSEENYLNYTKQTQFCMWQFFPKTRGNKNKQWTHLGALKSRLRDFMGNLLSFYTEMISASFLWGNVLLRGEPQKDEKIQVLKFLRAPLIWSRVVCL